MNAKADRVRTVGRGKCALSSERVKKRGPTKGSRTAHLFVYGKAAGTPGGRIDPLLFVPDLVTDRRLVSEYKWRVASQSGSTANASSRPTYKDVP